MSEGTYFLTFDQKELQMQYFFSIPPDFSPFLAQFWAQMIQFFKPNPGPYYTTTFGALVYFNFNYFGPNSTRQNQFLEQFLATRILCFFNC